MTGIEKLAQARKKHLDAVEAYNSRLMLVRAERERGNWSMKVDAEARAMWDAQSAFIGIAQAVADEAIGIAEDPEPPRDPRLSPVANIGMIKHRLKRNYPL